MAENVREWYNTFANNQIQTSINLRHYSIYNKIVKLGLKRDSTILEIGCGIGTLTSLLHNYVTKGFILGADISDNSIKIAKERIKDSKNINFIVTDMSDFVSNTKFDYVVLPDVLEHIPIDQHQNLFNKIDKATHENSFIFIHIPHPKAIDYITKTTPEKLQIIDQSLSANKLLEDAYKSNFILVEYVSYSLFNKEHDYAVVILKKNVDITYTIKSKYNIIFNKTLERLKYYFSLI